MAQIEKERRDWIEQATSLWAAEAASIVKEWEATVADDFTRQGGDPEDRDALREWMEECRPEMLALIAERRREWFCEDVPDDTAAEGAARERLNELGYDLVKSGDPAHYTRGGGYMIQAYTVKADGINLHNVIVAGHQPDVYALGQEEVEAFIAKQKVSIGEPPSGS
jgi:hypothetical protein